MDVRTVLRGLGKTFIAAGTLILLFVAFQLWGPGISEARAQRRLRHEFSAAPAPTLPSTSTTAPGPSTTGAPTSTTIEATPPPPPPNGAALAILRIPRIGVDAAVVEGVGVDNLKNGPGHYPRTPMPGQAGNAAIAGHRTTYGAPFYRLDELQPGDDVFVTTRSSPTPWHYQVEFSHDVSPSNVSVLDPSTDNLLTLTTCTPRFTASKRLVVVSKLVGTVDPLPPAPAPSPPVTGGPVGPVGPVGPTASPDAPVVAGSVGSLSGEGTSTWPAILWGLLCGAVWLAAWRAAHRWPAWRWAVYLTATPAFLVCLFVFFENFARFVPANI